MPTIRGCRCLLVFVLFAVAGCGGGVARIGTTGGDGGPVNPGDDLVGDDEIGPAQDGGPVDPRCASGNPIGTGLACSASGMVCPLGTISDCNGDVRTLECLCEGHSWSCEPVPAAPSCPPPSACPDPSVLFPGAACNGLVGQLCASTEIPSSTCSGPPPPPVMGICTCTSSGWACPQAKMPCPSPPPSSCPDPFGVYAGGYCTASGMDCSGNPQSCGNQTYYDALECEGNYWVTLARTSCDLYYNEPDSDGYDAPYLLGLEAGVVYESD
jgi:hypothetical protein